MKHHVTKVAATSYYHLRCLRQIQRRVGRRSRFGWCSQWSSQDWTTATQHWLVCHSQLSHFYNGYKTQRLAWFLSWALASTSCHVSYSCIGYQYTGTPSSNCAASCTPFSMGSSPSISVKHCRAHWCRSYMLRPSVYIVHGLLTATAANKVWRTFVLSRQSHCMEQPAWRHARGDRHSEVQKAAEDSLLVAFLMFSDVHRLSF